jgi:hypothetical protein
VVQMPERPLTKAYQALERARRGEKARPTFRQTTI